MNIDNSESAAKNPDVKNSFLAATSHFTLILIEHAILIICMLHVGFTNQFGYEHTVTFCWVPFLLWLLAAAAMIIYYKYCNKARLFRELGPEFHVCKNDSTKTPKSCCQRCSCSFKYTGLICCSVRNDVGVECDCKEESVSILNEGLEMVSMQRNGAKSKDSAILNKNGNEDVARKKTGVVKINVTNGHH